MSPRSKGTLLSRAKRWAALLCLPLSSVLVGCAGHEGRMETALAALDRGQPQQAIAAIDEELEVGKETDLPALEGDAALLLLDRGTIQLSLGKHELSSRDIGAADKSIDVLDLSRDTLDDVGKYLFSDDTGPYRAPGYEKLLINSLNLMNYLAMGDLEGARVEARRLAVIQDFLKKKEDETALVGLGSLLAGFTFEKSGKNDEAIIYYDEALKYAQYRSLRDPLRTLTQGTSNRPGIQALLGDSGALPPVSETKECDVFIVVGYGRVPAKEARRIPIGLALTLTAGYISPGDAATANGLAARGLVTWINYPVLGKSRGKYDSPDVDVDNRPLDMEQTMDVEGEVRKVWEKEEPTIIASAITRMIARAVAGEVINAGTKAASNSGVVGLLAGLATTATLAVLDTPDTRSWSTLPARVSMARVRVPAGRHVVRMRVRGTVRSVTIDAQPGGWSFVTASELR